MRLSSSTLDTLPRDVIRPDYDRAQVKRGVVHLGIGAFHRAHQAAIFDAALAAGDLRWGITGVSLRSPGVRDQLVPQDGLYTMLVRGMPVRDGTDDSNERAQVIGAVLDVLVAPENPAAVIAALAAPDTHIVTLTVTEKGYKLDRATGALFTDDPDVAHDLASLDAPLTAPGFIVAALARRRAGGLPPISILSCDNLPDNGKLLRGAVLAMAAAHDPALAAWIAAEIAFPATMVDRIVPATSDADIAALRRKLGVEDQAMVKTEPFTQWVIEDHFAGERPDFAALGVQLTSRVAAWEAAKLRLLNGSHSGMAYLGALAGIEFVHEAIAKPLIRAFVEALWDEASATLDPPPGLDIAAYRAQLLRRFTNPTLQHKLRQIAMDGSQKLPQRLLAPIAERRAGNLPVDALSLAVAAWMHWQAGIADDGSAFAVDDPLAATTAAAVRDDPRAMVEAMMGISAIFPPALAADDGLAAAIADHLATLITKGALAALANLARARL
ncbi:MAG: mannitol dehydrogenase family protein [Sphingomonas sp.]|jgi:fructuronate reductase